MKKLLLVLAGLGVVLALPARAEVSFVKTEEAKDYARKAARVQFQGEICKWDEEEASLFRIPMLAVFEGRGFSDHQLREIAEMFDHTYILLEKREQTYAHDGKIAKEAQETVGPSMKEKCTPENQANYVSFKQELMAKYADVLAQQKEEKAAEPAKAEVEAAPVPEPVAAEPEKVKAVPNPKAVEKE